MKTAKFLLTTMVIALLAACGTTRTVPITGRKQSLLVSDAEIMTQSLKEYNSYMATAKKSTHAANTAMVQRVGQRLASSVEAYLRNNGMAGELSQYAWEFNLVQDKSANAFCLPGGKIVVYEGLLPYTQNEAALAIVLGHEIAHAVAKHSAEQISKIYRQQYATQIGGTILGATVGSDVGNIVGLLAQTGFKFRNLKYSRDNETEADHIGLIFAAMAGYDPRVAIPFWQRMATGSSANRSDMFSDHPSDAKRIAALQQEMPEALKYYEASNKVIESTPPVATSKKKATVKKTTARKNSAKR